MAAYTPPSLSDSSPRGAAAVNAGFTTLATAMNGDLESTNNFIARDLTYREFYPHALTESWEGSSENEPAIWPVVFIGSGTSTTTGSGLPLGNPATGGRTNYYDVDDCCVRFTLPEAATIRYKVNVSADEVKTTWIAAGTITWEIFVTLWVDGEKAASKAISHTETRDQERPWSVNFTYSAARPAGTHDAWVTVSFTGSAHTVANVSAASPTSVSQIVSRHRSLIVEASYEPG